MTVYVRGDSLTCHGFTVSGGMSFRVDADFFFTFGGRHTFDPAPPQIFVECHGAGGLGNPVGVDWLLVARTG